MVLVSYDVSTMDAAGKNRLRKVAKECQNHGQRVQNSVFEMNLDYSTFLKTKDRLLKLIDEKQDSLRFYYLGNNWEHRVEHIGAKPTYNPEGVIIIWFVYANLRWLKNNVRFASKTEGFCQKKVVIYIC